MELTLADPEPVVLDPTGADVMGDGERIREEGGIVPGLLPGGAPVWLVASHKYARFIFGHADFSRDPKHWLALRKLPARWPLRRMIEMESMLNAEGADHKRLRGLVTGAFTARRVEELRPRIKELARTLIAELDAAGPDAVIDLRSTYNFQLPMGVICDLFGLTDATARQRLADNYQLVISNETSEEQGEAANDALSDVIGTLIREKRLNPGEDLTSALIAARGDEGGGSLLSEKELVETMFTMLFAGHETTRNFLTNGSDLLMQHPDQLALVREGQVSYGRVVDVGMQVESSIYSTMCYYATKDVKIVGTGVTVRKGEAAVILIAATGRDPEQFGPNAGQFDLTRESAKRHLSFGHGAHRCIGAALAQTMAATALEELFTRFDVQLAPGTSEAEPWEPTFSSHVKRRLLVTLTPRTAG